MGRVGAALVAVLLSGTAQATAQAPVPVQAQSQPSGAVTVSLAPAMTEAQSGRLLVFARRIDPAAKPDNKDGKDEKADADSVKVYAEATVVFPLIVAATFAKAAQTDR